jgi:outer membrane receptor protein involved in Fe transport
VLNYNFSWARTETWVPASKVDTAWIVIGGFKFPKYLYSIREKKDKLEGQPEFFGNLALGYDIAGFSARVSVFYQSEYPISYSIDAKNDAIQGEFLRLDLAFKYELSKNLSFFLNLNNINNAEEKTYTLNRVKGWKILQSSERYGITSDLGVRYTF